MKTYQKAAALLLALALIFAFPIPASAAETTEARVPITLTVVNTVAPISCTVPAALPVSLVDGYVVTANNAAITNTGKNGAIRVTKVDVQPGTFEIGKVIYSLDFEVTPHQLRHTYITNLIHSSVDPKTVQYLAGHESSKITMDIYAKVKYNRPDELVRTMGGAFAQWDAAQA